MKATRVCRLVCALLIIGSGEAYADGGFASRDQNPILQPLYLPTLAVFNARNGWKIDHSLYVTNTLQDENKGDERLLIDVENYRYELGLRYRQDDWLARVDLPFVSNTGGELDSTIDAWHDFFGFPDGNRNDYPNDQINVKYRRDGELEYRQDSRSSGIGDIALAVGYQANDQLALFAGIELPTGDSADFSGNDEVDTALWLSYQLEVDGEKNVFALFGLSMPGDGDYLGGLVEDYIWVAQAGFDFRLYETVITTIQLDMHSATVKDSSLTAFDNSVQIQIGVGFLRLLGEHRLDLFFSEDILVGSAPDVSFGIRLTRAY